MVIKTKEFTPGRGQAQTNNNAPGFKILSKIRPLNESVIPEESIEESQNETINPHLVNGDSLKSGLDNL